MLPERGTSNPSQPERGTTTANSGASAASAAPSYYPSYGGGYSGGGYRGGGGYRSSGGQSPEDAQEETQASINNRGAIYGKRAKDMGANTKGRAKDLDKNAKQRQKDMDKTSQMTLNNINNQMATNDAKLASTRRANMQQVNWQPNQQKEQSMLMALRNRMGNAALGSGIQDLREGLGRVDDMNDVELINTWKQNDNAAYDNWLQADTSLRADYNDQVASILNEFSSFGADYNDQRSKLKWEYSDDVSRNNLQYWSDLNNVNPRLATEENINQSRENAAAKSKTSVAKQNYKKAKATKKTVIKQLSTQGKSSKKSSGKMSAVDKRATAIIKKATNENKGKSSEVISKAAKEAANNNVKSTRSIYKKAKKKSSKVEPVTYGEGTNEYTLPDVDLTTEVDLGEPVAIGPSNKLKGMLKTKENSSTQNPYTVQNVRQGGYDRNAGFNNDMQANTGFGDNLSSFTRSEKGSPTVYGSGQIVTSKNPSVQSTAKKMSYGPLSGIDPTFNKEPLVTRTASKNSNVQSTARKMSYAPPAKTRAYAKTREKKKKKKK